ncbi:pyridoxamine 5'-phosphate oxidase family protein [Paenibacillus gansuensis]|uniref:Pyridoxamine 5'-phosphate oxidase family protein n=1 Tax=Paenibacillus gansuensis TaxID=306542 RepID=A0ABW5P7Z7_9BACL
MDQSNLQHRIMQAMDRNPVCSFATVEGNRPKVRYMMLFHEQMTVYLATDRKTHKVEELEANPHVHLLFGMDKETVSLEGTGKVSDDPELRSKIWNREFEHWFSGPDDPDYVVLVITPSRVEFSDKDMNLEVWEG